MRNLSCGALLTMAVALLPQSVGAADISAVFNVDVGPMTMTEVRFDLDASGDALHARARIKSNGISRIFSEYSVEAETEARVGGEAVQPVRFHMVREKDESRKEVTLTWSAAGDLAYEPRIKKPVLRQKVDAALGKGVLDPLTVILRMGAGGASPCPSVHQVFDGRDVFELAFVDKGRGKPAGQTSYDGEVQNCEVRWTPVAGRAMEKKLPGDVYNVSFAPVGKLASGGTVWLPVFLSGKLKGVGFSAYVTKLKTDDGGVETSGAQ